MKISRLIYSSSCHKNQPFRPFACYFCWRRFQNAKDRPRHWEGQSNDAHEVANHREAPQDPLGDIDLHLFRQNRGWIFRKWTNYDLVGGWPTPLKNIRSSVGMMTFPIEWKVIKFMFQTTNQMIKKKHTGSIEKYLVVLILVVLILAIICPYLSLVAGKLHS